MNGPQPGEPDPIRAILEFALDAPAGDAGAGGPDLSLLEAALKSRSPNAEAAPPETLARFLGRVTRAYVLDVLQCARGSRSIAARLLGIDRTTLYRLMKRHGITGREKGVSGETGR